MHLYAEEDDQPWTKGEPFILEFSEDQENGINLYDILLVADPRQVEVDNPNVYDETQEHIQAAQESLDYVLDDASTQ